MKWLIIRYSCYTAAVAIMTAGMLELASIEAEDWSFQESGLVEWMQFAAVLATGFILIWSGRRWEGSVRGPVGVAGLLAWVAAVRELDYVFVDSGVPYLSWWQPAAALLILIVVFVAGWRETEKQALRKLAASPPAIFLFIGFVTVVFFAQLAGRGDVWKAVMGNSYSHDFKRTLEELVEIYGYFWLLAGAVETSLWLRRQGGQFSSGQISGNQ